MRIGNSKILVTIAFLIVMTWFALIDYWQTGLIGLISLVGGAMTSAIGGGGNLTIPTLMALGFNVAIAVGLSRVAFLSAAYVSLKKQQQFLRTPMQQRRLQIAKRVGFSGGVLGALLLQGIGPAAKVVAPALLIFTAYSLMTERKQALRHNDEEVAVVFQNWKPIGKLFGYSLFGGFFGGGVAPMLFSALTEMLPDESPRRVFAVRQGASWGFNLGAVVGYSYIILGDLWPLLMHPAMAMERFGVGLLSPAFLVLVMVAAGSIGAIWGNDFVNSLGESKIRQVMGWASLFLVVLLIGKEVYDGRSVVYEVALAAITTGYLLLRMQYRLRLRPTG
jgi:uncharacterized membrane protein YfcA